MCPNMNNFDAVDFSECDAQFRWQKQTNKQQEKYVNSVVIYLWLILSLHTRIGEGKIKEKRFKFKIPG